MKYYFTLWWVAFCWPLFSQGRSYYVEHFYRGKGVPTEHINGLLGSAEGYLWLATRQGLYRYDGYEFGQVELRQDSVNLPHYSITQIVPAGDGNFFLALGNHGFGVYDPVLEQLQLYQSNPGDPLGLPANQVHFILDDGNKAWILLDGNGLVAFDKCTGEFRHYLPSKLLNAPPDRANELISLALDPLHPGRLWISSVYGLLSFDKTGEEFQLMPAYQGAGDDFSILSVAVGESGLLYATTWHQGVLCWDTRSGKWLGPIPGGREAGLTSVNFIKHKGGGAFWISDIYKGLFIYDAWNKTLEQALPLASQPGNVQSENYQLGGTVLEMACDAFGAWWMVEQTKGLGAIFPKKQSLARYHLPAGGQCVARQPGTSNLFSTTNSRVVYRIDEASGKVEAIPVKNRRLDQYLFRSCWCDEQGRFFMLGGEAIYQYFPEQQAMAPLNIPALEAMLQDEDIWACSAMFDSWGQLWVGTNRGILQFNEGLELEKQHIFSDTTEGARVRWNGFTGLLEAPGHRIWFIADRGFGYTQDNGQSFFRYGPSSPRSRPLGLSNLQGLTRDGAGRIWVGSRDKGLGFVYDQQPHPQEIQILAVEDGLANDQIRDMAISNDGSLWALTVQGIVHIPVNGLLSQNFGTGYQQELTNCYDINPLDDGRLSIGHISGFFLLEPEKLAPDTSFLPVTIQGLKVFDEPFQEEEALLSETDVRLSYRQNFFTITYAAPRAGSPEPVLYQYKLEGFDGGWRDAGTSRYAPYTNVGEGHYIFKVRSSTVPGVWSEDNIRSLSIRIAPPYWRAWWFRLLAGLLVIAIVALGFWYKLRQVRREEAIRSDFNRKVAELEMQALKAQMNPHFLFNSLQSIKWHLIHNSPEVSVRYIDRFAALVRRVLNNSKSNLVRLAEELEALELYIQIEQSRFPGRFEYEIQVNPEIPADFVQFPPLLLQPFVENAIWHGLMHKENGCGKLDVRARKVGYDLEIEIEDNGIGREKARLMQNGRRAAHPSMGIKLTQERLAVFERMLGFKAEMEVIDLKDEMGNGRGTRIFIRLPQWLD